MKNLIKIKLNKFNEGNNGILVPLETENNISFRIKRIFYTYNVPTDSERGAHAYYNTKQVLICLSGSIEVRCFDGNSEVVYVLNKPDEGLYISPHIWRTTFNHSSDAVLLVLSSQEYDEKDYIRDYDKFLEVIRCI